MGPPASVALGAMEKPCWLSQATLSTAIRRDADAWGMGGEGLKEAVQFGQGPLDLDAHPAGEVAHTAGQSAIPGQTADEGPEAHPLHDAVNHHTPTMDAFAGRVAAGQIVVHIGAPTHSDRHPTRPDVRKPRALPGTSGDYTKSMAVMLTPVLGLTETSSLPHRGQRRASSIGA